MCLKDSILCQSDPHSSSLQRTVACEMNSHWRSSQRTDSCGMDPTMQQGKDSSSWEVAETMCDELTITTHALPSCISEGEEVEGGKRKRQSKGIFKIYFTSLYPALIFLAINSVNISNLNLFFLWQYLLSDISQTLSQLMNLFYIFSPLSSWEVE